MKTAFLTLLLLSQSIFCLAQFGLSKKTQPIVEEGKRLYRSEMASWNGTEIFLQNYPKTENIGGYFSYEEGEVVKCIFFSKTDKPKVIGTISFDETFQIDQAKLDLNERPFTDLEEDLYIIRKKAIDLSETEDFYSFYENTNLNFIPIISEGEKKVYVLTGPSVSGVVVFGNDYLIRFNKRNKIKEKKGLHANIIPIYDESEDGTKQIETIHSHTESTGDFITATDICTLMLYCRFTDWERHHVVSPKYLNTWDCEKQSLIVIPMDVLDNIDEAQKSTDKNED